MPKRPLSTEEQLFMFNYNYYLLEEHREMRHLTDKEVFEANQFILENLGDADFASKAECRNGRDPRDKISLEDIEYMQEENRLLAMGHRRN